MGHQAAAVLKQTEGRHLAQQGVHRPGRRTLDVIPGQHGDIGGNILQRRVLSRCCQPWLFSLLHRRHDRSKVGDERTPGLFIGLLIDAS